MVGLGAFALGMVATVQAGNYALESLGIVIILLAILGNGLFLGITFLHLYPEIGISETHLWYRHFGFWHTVPWDEIETVSTAKTLFLTQGLVVYSSRLLLYYWFFGIAYGRKAGKVLFVPNRLTRFDELKARLRRYVRHRGQGY